SGGGTIGPATRPSTAPGDSGRAAGAGRADARPPTSADSVLREGIVTSTSRIVPRGSESRTRVSTTAAAIASAAAPIRRRRARLVCGDAGSLSDGLRAALLAIRYVCNQEDRPDRPRRLQAPLAAPLAEHVGNGQERSEDHDSISIANRTQGGPQSVERCRHDGHAVVIVLHADTVRAQSGGEFVAARGAIARQRNRDPVAYHRRHRGDDAVEIFVGHRTEHGPGRREEAHLLE